MTTFRNVLISLGVFWLSFWAVVPFEWPFMKLRIIYGDGVLSAIGMGIMDSIGRTLAAILAGVLVTLVVSGRKSELWSLLVAFLYVADSRVRYHWYLSPTSWDRLSQVVNFVFPGLACIAAALICARLRRHRRDLMMPAD